MVCLCCSPRRWCLTAANHATDRLDILRVSFPEVGKEGCLVQDAIAAETVSLHQTDVSLAKYSLAAPGKDLHAAAQMTFSDSRPGKYFLRLDGLYPSTTEPEYVRTARAAHAREQRGEPQASR